MAFRAMGAVGIVLVLFSVVETKKVDVVLGVLLEDDPRLPYSLARVAPAIQLAVNVVNKRASLGSLRLTPRFVSNLRCETFSMQVGAMAMYYEHQKGQHHCSKDRNRPSVLLGPSCDFPAASIVRLASYWNIPSMTVAVPWALQNRREDAYKTSIRTSVSSGEVGRFVLRVLDKFNWTRSFSVASHGGGPGNHTCYFLVRGIYDEWRVREGVNVQANVFSEFQEVDFDLESEEGLSRLDEKLRNTMTEAKGKARVIITCASAPYVWRLMKVAGQMGMTNGDYVFLILDMFDHAYLQRKTWVGSEGNPQEQQAVLDAFRAAFIITVPRPNTTTFRNFSKQVREIGKQNFGFDSQETLANPFVESYYNDVMLYATALSRTPGYNYSNGTEMALRMRNLSFTGADGEEVVVKNGDRVFDFIVLDLNRSSGSFVAALSYNGSSQNFTELQTIDWVSSEPMREPEECVWDENCPDPEVIPSTVIILSVVIGVIVIASSVIIYFYKRKNDLAVALRSEQEKLVQWEDIQMDEGRPVEGSVYRMQVAPADPADMQKWHSRLTLGAVQVFATTGIYKGKRVVIKDSDCQKSSITMTDAVLLELKRMRDLGHDHVVRFVGVCFKSPRVFILTEYCPRGSLQDTLENEEIHLDIEFQCSLMHDIVKGMVYLQSSEVHYHGNLKSSNCVVDSRFVVKLTDFGLPTFRAPPNKPPQGESCYRKRLWTAPELLRGCELTVHAVHKADVYGFGIIMQEIVQRQGPFYMADDPNASAQDIVEKVQLGSQHGGKLCRPDVPAIDDARYSKPLQTLMQQCWEEDPNLRPEFGSIRTQMRQIDRGRNLMDTLLSRLEQYASNLEEMVQERTEELAVEKKKSDELLYQMLPQAVAENLRQGRSVEAETYDRVTIYFSDIVGFTGLVESMKPVEVVDLLNDLYTLWDKIISRYDVYKVETIGDAYMLVSGLPKRNGNEHARQIAGVSLALRQAVQDTMKIRNRPDQKLKIRIGLHTGPCAAGVVGLKMPRYCLFGDTVNIASRMESNGEAMKIHVSPETKRELEYFTSFILQERGEIIVKGRELPMTTYWLLGELQAPETVV
ncbi:NPR1 [Branchiostoma lanceolatum]|uniref:Guanylate cyclase n=1 Tax=Branchiostoma lanceolatum TaxID=7740 RepID=A0A8J9ZBM1_BRALA|nr:NPR1 [Branchiostoma lanceolatum]